MAGIFGVFRFDNGPVDRTLAARMSDALAHRGADSHVVFGSSSALGSRPRYASATIDDIEPARRPPGIHVVFDGRLDNRAELVQQLQNHCESPAAISDAALAAAMYDLKGSTFAKQLEGDFAVAVFDGSARRVVLARDAIGVRPLYYRRTPATLTFASEVKALLVDATIAVRPNDALLAGLMLGQLHRRDHDGSTLFSDIFEVPPAHAAVFDVRTSDVRRYWDFDGRVPQTLRSFDEYVEEFRRLFETAVRRRVRGSEPIAVAVSGGLDSSSVFAVAGRASTAPLMGLSYSTDDGGPADESGYLADLERASGMAIRAVNVRSSEDALFRANELVRRVEAPMANAEWRRADGLVAAAQESGARTLISGHWGDQLLFDQAYLVDMLHAGRWRTLRAHLREYPAWFPEASRGEFAARLAADVLEFDLPRSARNAVRLARRRWQKPAPWDDWYSDRFKAQAAPDVFAEELNSAGASGAITVFARAIYREVRSRYHGLCFDWHNKLAAAHGVDRAFPFLDRDLVAFVMKVPGGLLARNGQPKAMLRSAMREILPVSIVARRTKGDFTAAVNAARRRETRAIGELLTKDALVAQLGYVDVDKLARGLDAVTAASEESRSSVASWRVTALVALELWLREFAGTETGTRTREDRPWHDNSPVIVP